MSSVVRSLFVDQVRSTAEPLGALVRVDTDPNRLSVDGRSWKPGGITSIEDELVYVLLQASLEADPDRLHLHTGLVVHRNASVLVGGLAGSGKSTLIAQLVEHGLDYGTDERVAVDREGVLSVFEKPVSVVRSSFPLLARFDPRATGKGSASDHLWHVPASAIRLGSQVSAVPPLAAIVLVEFRKGAAPESALMHPITVARVLLADSIDQGRFGPDGPMVATRLCASVPCFSVIHSGGAQAVEHFMRQVDRFITAGHPEVVVEAVGPGDRPAQRGARSLSRSSVVGRARGISGAVAADRMLVRTASGDLVELDEVQTAWIQLIDGTTSLGSLVDEVAAANGMSSEALFPNVLSVVQGLADLGVAA